MRLVKSSPKKPKPFLKWVGGKGKLVAEFSALMPESYKNFYEPFVGGGALFFYVTPKHGFINDINTGLVGAYENVKNNSDTLIKLLLKIQAIYYTLDEEARKDFYYKIREEYNQIKDPLSLRKSCHLIFLNKTCYNGMYRENSKGGFNVPFGNYKQPLICDADTILADSEVLKTTKITSLSFQDAVLHASKGDFIYLDPPYYPLSKTSNFTSYSVFGFVEEDQVRLKNTYDALHKKGCFVMLSNSSALFIKDLYKQYRQETVLANRAVNCKATGRGKIEELLILNY